MRKIIEFFIGDNNNLEKNLKKYAEKEKIEQQKPKVLGQKPVKGKERKEKSTILRD